VYLESLMCCTRDFVSRWDARDFILLSFVAFGRVQRSIPARENRLISFHAIFLEACDIETTQ
jgi:hypothetical protein